MPRRFICCFMFIGLDTKCTTLYSLLATQPALLRMNSVAVVFHLFPLKEPPLPQILRVVI